MTLKLELVSDHREIVGDDAVREFHEKGGTIGRSLQNDWILPDPDRFISGRHATIDHKGGIYYLLDTSSNGVYINGDCEPVGKGNSRRLFNGDRLRLGDFEIVVTIDAGESIVVPEEEAAAVVPGHDQSLVDEDHLRSSVMLLDEEEITGDDDFQSALFGEAADTGVAKAAVAKAEPKRVAPHAVTPLAEADLVATDLLDSFLDGLGINRAELRPSTDLAEVMQNAGEVMREFVVGTTRLLASRAGLKNTFRLDQTTILPRQNNALKLSANFKDSIMQLLVGKEGEYLGPRDSVHEVCRDLLFHQDAFLEAMNAAFADFADRFEPDELEEEFDRSLGSNALTKMMNKKKYWQLYRDLYPSMTETSGGMFPQMFADDFVKAYERQIAEFKRAGVVDDFRETVVLDQDKVKLDPGPDSSNDDIGPEDDSSNDDVLPEDDSSNEDLLPAEEMQGDESPDQAKS